MRIATFNINGINRRLPNLLAWLADTRPGAACLQVLKCTQADFPAGALRDAGYHAAWVGEGRWNGVALLSRTAAPLIARRRLPGAPEDHQARYIEAAINGVLIACLYLPNGNPQPGPKFAYKLAWFDRLIAHAATLCAAGIPVILAGDYNVVPTDTDIYATKGWTSNALLRPQSRAAYARLLAQGWTDALRHLRPHDRRLFTFWDYLRDHWRTDHGMRLDHLLLSPTLAPRLRAAGVDRDVRGQPDASDHAPAWIEIEP